MTLALRYAARSDVGMLREINEDSGYAGPGLLAVADGIGGQAAGEVASAAVIATIAPLDNAAPGADVLAVLRDAVRGANQQLRRMATENPSLEGMGTTLTAIKWVNGRVALCHVGDSQGHLLRGGRLQQITKDHTLVQTLLDEGRITPEEAAVYPHRSVIMRALDGREDVDPDLSIREALPGDRYLLCSDGLTNVVSTETIEGILRQSRDPNTAIHQLIELANRAGGPDNITVVIGDVVDTTLEPPPPPQGVFLVGAASNVGTEGGPPATGRAAPFTAGPDDEDDDGDEPPSRRRGWPGALFGLALFGVLLLLAGWGTWAFAQSQYYVGAHEGEVAIFRGLSQQVAGRDFSRVYELSGVPLADLPVFERHEVQSNIDAGNLDGAEQIVQRLRREAEACVEAREARARAEKREQQQRQRDQNRAGQSGTGDKSDGARAAGTQGAKPKRSPSPSPSPTPETPRGCPEGGQ